MADFTKLNGVAAADIAKINAIDKSSISKINNMTVPSTGTTATRWVIVQDDRRISHATNSDVFTQSPLF